MYIFRRQVLKKPIGTFTQKIKPEPEETIKDV
jgi:hypothetical protein